MIEWTKYTRKPFPVNAIQITADNMEEVAKAIGSEIRTDHHGAKYVYVEVFKPLNDRQTKGYIGDWMLSANNGYKAYTDKAFQNSFDKVEEKVA